LGNNCKFFVQDAGIYPVRILFQDNGGAAHIELASVKANGDKVLVNDLDNGGFKAYRVGATRNLTLSVDGYDFPLQFWVQAAANGLRVREIPVRRIYKDLNRTFGGDLDDPERRLRVYRETMHRELHRCRRRLSPAATRALLCTASKQDAQDG